MIGDADHNIETFRRWRDDASATFVSVGDLNRKALAEGLTDEEWAERSRLNEVTGRALADLFRRVVVGKKSKSND